ncbi:MAG: vacJ-like lipoprotein [Rubritepida sp.]|nr:vacJ-like lipoprotein [Rubritepida sp.]
MLLALLLLTPLPAAAQEAPPAGWLERASRAVYGFNRAAVGGFSAVREQMPEMPAVPPEWRLGAANLVTTWIGEPWQALTLAAAGRPEYAWTALDRVRTNILEGRGGLIDRASEIGMPSAPQADIGLALCARGVPEGPFLVLPVIGGRTLRDGLSDLVVANALIYGSLIPFTGPTPSWQLLVTVELLDNIPIWALAERMGREDGVDAQRMDYDIARDLYIAGRRRACEVLREPIAAPG